MKPELWVDVYQTLFEISQFSRLRDTPAMTLKPLLANENEIAMKEKQ